MKSESLGEVVFRFNDDFGFDSLSCAAGASGSAGGCGGSGGCGGGGGCNGGSGGCKGNAITSEVSLDDE